MMMGKNFLSVKCTEVTCVTVVCSQIVSASTISDRAIPNHLSVSVTSFSHMANA